MTDPSFTKYARRRGFILPPRLFVTEAELGVFLKMAYAHENEIMALRAAYAREKIAELNTSEAEKKKRAEIERAWAQNRKGELE